MLTTKTITRRVHFPSNEATVRLIRVSSHLSLEDYCKQWYLESELEAFKTESRHTCAKLRKNVPEHNVVDLSNVHSTKTTTEKQQRTNVDDDDDCLRGLEARMSRDRQVNRTLAIRAILAAQHRFRDPELLAVAARRCTAWAREIARNTAILDYYQVYLPDQAAASQPPALPSALCPLAFLRKRLHEKDESVERRVRPCNGPVVARWRCQCVCQSRLDKQRKLDPLKCLNTSSLGFELFPFAEIDFLQIFQILL